MEAPCCSRARSNRHRSTRGIGYAIACRFIEEGAAVTVFGSRQETADAAVEKLTAVYPDAKVWGRSCDLTSLEAVTEAFTQAAADMGGLDTVVNTPASPSARPFWTIQPRSSPKYGPHVVAVFNGHQAAAKIMTEAGHGGTITTTSSMVAKYGQPTGVGSPHVQVCRQRHGPVALARARPPWASASTPLRRA